MGKSQCNITEVQNSQTCLNQSKSYTSFESMNCSEPQTEPEIRSYKRRFWMLFLFSTLSMLSGMVFPEYAAMSDINMCFYGVSAEAINWTCLIFMVVYIVLVFPVSWMVGQVGLRTTVIMGSVCNTLSYAVQFGTLTTNHFPYVMISSFFGSLSNVFVLAVPPYIAALWFPSHEVSRACAMGVFGNQLGVALGFVVSPLLVPTDCENKDLIANGKKNVAIILTTVNSLVLLLILFTFQKEPKCPPSIAQAEKKDIKESYLQSAIAMAKNINFVLVFIMYGLVVGVYYGIATILNSLILSYFPGADDDIGWMGLLVIMAGLVGSVIAGCILDYTHRFKETSVSICFISFFCYSVFSCVLIVNTLWLQFLTIGVLGFFLTSFLPVGFEYAIEVTYPESEITSAGLLNSSAMIFGIILTETSSYFLQNVGPEYANGVMAVSLLVASIICCFVTSNYRRSNKNNDASA